MNKRIKPHEPEEELLSAEDVAKDLAVLERAFARRRARQEQEMLVVSVRPITYHLIANLVDLGVCSDAEEVIAKAVRAFFVAVSPSFPDDILLQAAGEEPVPAASRSG